MAKVFPFSALPTADLVIDAVYEGGTKGNTAGDVLGKLIPGAGNQGGFRAVGSWDAPRLVILYSSMDDADWPDFIDVYTGVFTYFGDNKKPGFDLHDTPRRGNKLLQSCFAILHNAPDQKVKIPPFLVFTKGSKGRDVVFRGLAVPGVEADPADDLVAIWRSKKGERFQNYRAKFTILDIGTVSREWVDGVKAGEPHASAPAAWRKWMEKGVYEPLTAEPTIEYRTKEEQQPAAGRDESLVRCIYGYFKDNPHGFEYCAARLAGLMDLGGLSPLHGAQCKLREDGKTLSPTTISEEVGQQATLTVLRRNLTWPCEIHCAVTSHTVSEMETDPNRSQRDFLTPPTVACLVELLRASPRWERDSLRAIERPEVSERLAWLAAGPIAMPARMRATRNRRIHGDYRREGDSL
jgi:hypothetical protein